MLSQPPSPLVGQQPVTAPEEGVGQMNLGPDPEDWGGAGQGAPIFSTPSLSLSRPLAQISLIINGLTTLGQAL